MNRRYQTRLAMGEKELRRPAYGSEESEISAEVLHSHMKDLTDMTVSPTTSSLWSGQSIADGVSRS